jgi:L-ectoine synthase
MKIIDVNNLPSERVVQFHSGVSNRILLKSDGMGYTMTKTVVEPGQRVFQHYKNHLESCLCIGGHAILENAATGEIFNITPGVCYVLDKHDPHYFEAYEETVLICVFNPPLTGQEIHQEDGSYTAEDPYTNCIFLPSGA